MGAVQTADSGEAATSDSSLLFGKAGILLVAWRIAPSEELADRLFACVRENAWNEVNEVMWGAPGSMLAAHAMHAWTSDGRWRDAWTECADELRSRRDTDGLWTQHRGGHSISATSARLTAPSGTWLALLQGSPTRTSRTSPRRSSAPRSSRTASRTGRRSRASSSAAETARSACSGATARPASSQPRPRTYRRSSSSQAPSSRGSAGPHGKGPGLCHGTAGNGYAFLKAFERTGDERWLDRARRFAVHALDQVERQATAATRSGTGDLGVALYAADCLDARADVPVLDGFD